MHEQRDPGQRISRASTSAMDETRRPSTNRRYTAVRFNVDSILELKGRYNFDIKMQSNDPQVKTYYFSEKLQVAFVKRETVFSVQFLLDFPSESEPNDENLVVRASLLRDPPCSPDYPFKMCTFHSRPFDPDLTPDENEVCRCKSIIMTSHFLQSRSTNTAYNYNPSSRKHSVLVMIENSTTESSFLFTSYSTDRLKRIDPHVLVFTLENFTGSVLARRTIRVKSCDKPILDVISREKLFMDQEGEQEGSDEPIIALKLKHDLRNLIESLSQLVNSLEQGAEGNRPDISDLVDQVQSAKRDSREINAYLSIIQTACRTLSTSQE